MVNRLRLKTSNSSGEMMWGEMRWSQPNQVRPGFSPQMSYWMEKIEGEIERDKRNQTFGCGIGFTKFVEQMKQCCQLGTERKIEAAWYLTQKMILRPLHKLRK